MPDKEEDSHAQCHLFVFLFHLFSFHLFATIVTRALLLGTIKGEARATSRGTRLKHNSLSKHSNSPITKETWDPLPLSKKLVTPTTSTLVQGNTSSSNIHWMYGHFCPNQYKPLCPHCTPSGPRRVDTNLHVLVSRIRF
jgi:hypothetical protein